MFRHLKTKLTLAYGGLLGLILAVISVAVYFSIQNTARGKIADEMRATSAVYSELWRIQAEKLEENASVTAKDFGLREAVATNDIATIASALDNISGRVDIDAAYIVLSDGRVVSPGMEQTERVEPGVWQALTSRGETLGVLAVDEVPYQMVSAQVRAPDLVGWVMFGYQLGAERMQELETLSSIPLNARIVMKPDLTDLEESSGDNIVRLTNVRGFGDMPEAVLVLKYPLAGAMAPFRPMLYAILVMAVGGSLALLICSWFISRSVTGPITKLDHATHELASGKRVHVKVSTNDEIGRLAESFERMAGEIERREDNILRLSLTDTESDLPNRRALHAILQEFQGHTGKHLYCAAISPDRFAKIMAVIGHSSTNLLIAQLGKRIESQASVEGVGRLGTDMIGLVVRARTLDEAHACLAAITTAVSSPIEIDGEKVDIQLSTGFAHHDETNRLHALDRAVIALQQGRQRHAKIFEFDAEAYGDPSGTLSLMSEMIAGLENGQIHMAYQPKIDLRTQKIEGAEALLRWEHPVHGFVSPEDFVRTAEETGHIRPLSEWVLQQVRKDRQAFLDAGMDIKMAVNLSGRLLTDTEFLDWSITLLKGETSRYCFEVTETAVIDDPALALANIQRLREAGIEISIDDYGSGLSSLTYLKQIPAHELKIDKSFVMTLSAGSSDALLIKSTIDLAHSLGMTVTAEGVETAEVMAILSGMGADAAQGYFIARPQACEKTLDFLRNFVADAPRDKGKRGQAGRKSA